MNSYCFDSPARQIVWVSSRCWVVSNLPIAGVLSNFDDKVEHEFVFFPKN